MSRFDLSQQRCLNHQQREAVARCPECKRYFCRECIAEHEDRVLCASCLRKLQAPEDKKKRPLRLLFRTIQLLCSVLLLWLFFYYMGEVLLLFPTSFHEGTFWEKLGES